MIKFIGIIILSSVLANLTAKAEIAINDGHIHYDEDVWSSLTPVEAANLLRQQNIQRALISATPTIGAEKIYAVAPELVVPMLRPYKSWRHRYFWFKDPALKQYLLEHLARAPYRGFGEFHIFGDDVLSKPVDQMIELAREKKLALHPHADLKAMQIFLNKAPDLVIIWAHGGFKEPVKVLKQLLDKYPRLYIELSLREGMLEDGETLTSEWRQFLIDYQQRFMVGADTYKPSRWADLPETIADIRSWIKQLPDDVAEDIARNNINRLFPPVRHPVNQ